MSTEKKSNSWLALALAVIGAPFIVTLVKFLKKGPDEPVKMSDLMAVFGVQVLVAALIVAFLLFFYHPTAVLG